MMRLTARRRLGGCVLPIRTPDLYGHPAKTARTNEILGRVIRYIDETSARMKRHHTTESDRRRLPVLAAEFFREHQTRNPTPHPQSLGFITLDGQETVADQCHGMPAMQPHHKIERIAMPREDGRTVVAINRKHLRDLLIGQGNESKPSCGELKKVLPIAGLKKPLQLFAEPCIPPLLLRKDSYFSQRGQDEGSLRIKGVVHVEDDDHRLIGRRKIG